MNFAHADPNLFSIFILHTDDSDDLPFSFIHMFGLAFSLLVRIHFLLIREGVAIFDRFPFFSSFYSCLSLPLLRLALPPASFSFLSPPLLFQSVLEAGKSQ